MWRAFFLAVGIYGILLGVECLAIDKAVLAPSRDSSASALVEQMSPGAREIVPPTWAPWSLISGGAVVVLYSFTLPNKWKG